MLAFTRAADRLLRGFLLLVANGCVSFLLRDIYQTQRERRLLRQSLHKRLIFLAKPLAVLKFHPQRADRQIANEQGEMGGIGELPLRRRLYPPRPGKFLRRDGAVCGSDETSLPTHDGESWRDVRWDGLGQDCELLARWPLPQTSIKIREMEREGVISRSIAQQIQCAGPDEMGYLGQNISEKRFWPVAVGETLRAVEQNGIGIRAGSPICSSLLCNQVCSGNRFDFGSQVDFPRLQGRFLRRL